MECIILPDNKVKVRTFVGGMHYDLHSPRTMRHTVYYGVFFLCTRIHYDLPLSLAMAFIIFGGVCYI